VDQDYVHSVMRVTTQGDFSDQGHQKQLVGRAVPDGATGRPTIRCGPGLTAIICKDLNKSLRNSKIVLNFPRQMVY
jgi:hypothetical protein